MIGDNNEASLLTMFMGMWSERLKKLKLGCGFPHLPYGFFFKMLYFKWDMKREET